MNNITKDLENLSINSSRKNNNNSDSDKMEQRNFIMQNLKMIYPFSGQLDQLNMYIGSIESIIPNITTMPTEDRTLFFHCIVRTLEGEALNMYRREQPEDWASLRKLLIMEFGENKNITHLIFNLTNIKFRNSTKKLCEEINNLVCRIKDAINLCNENTDRKTFYKNETDYHSLKVLKRELPNHLVALLNANLVRDFKTARQLLRENNELEEGTQFGIHNSNRVRQRVTNNNGIPNRRFPHQSQNNYSQQNFYPQQYNRTKDFYQERTQNNYPHNFNEHNNQYHFGNQNNNQSRINNNYNPNKRMREYDSNQSRVRRFGAPVPMEIENFHLTASNNYPPFQ